MEVGMENRHVAANYHRQSPQPSRQSRALETSAHGLDGDCQSLREAKSSNYIPTKCRRRKNWKFSRSAVTPVARHHHRFQTRGFSFRFAGSFRIPRGTTLLETSFATLE